MGISTPKTKGMSIDTLKAELQARELEALSQYKQLRNYSPTTLAACGYKAAHEVLDYALKMNEARLRDWEKNNPA